MSCSATLNNKLLILDPDNPQSIPDKRILRSLQSPPKRLELDRFCLERTVSKKIFCLLLLLHPSKTTKGDSSSPFVISNLVPASRFELLTPRV